MIFSFPLNYQLESFQSCQNYNPNKKPVTITGTKYTDSTTRTSLPFDVEDGVVEAQANGTLKRGLKNRHMQMIANGMSTTSFTL